MKLYATVTSERASKGQGGNEYIIVKLLNEKQETIATVSMYPREKNQTHEILRIDYQRNVVALQSIPWDEIKGKRQKGEVIKCTGSCKEIVPHNNGGAITESGRTIVHNPNGTCHYL